MEWQPISTAPKDGVPVIIAAVTGDVGEAEFQDGKWWWAGSYGQRGSVPVEQISGPVTHWMPFLHAPIDGGPV